MGSEKPRERGVSGVRRKYVHKRGPVPPPPQLEQNGELLPRAGGGSHTRVGLRKVWAV